MTHLLRLPLLLVWGVCLATLLASFCGTFHPIGDSLAVFRQELALVALVGCIAALFAWPPKVAGVAAILCASAVASTLAGSAPPPSTDGGHDFRLYQKNLLFRMTSPDALLADIADVEPDFLTLQEVRGANRAVLARSGLAHTHLCDFSAVGGVAVASRWPVVRGSRSCDYGVAKMKVRTPTGDVWVASVHLHWPWPHGQAAQVRQLAQSLSTPQEPWVVGGDFNMVPWSASMRRLIGATGTRVASGHRRTFPLMGWYPIPIDHVLVPGDTAVLDTSIRPRNGSDHFGVVVHFQR